MIETQTDEPQKIWKPITLPSFTAVSLLTLPILYLSNTNDQWVPILDSANLMFHEAGHPLVGLLSSRLMVYGGTLGQLAFPAATAFYFAKRKDTMPTYACFIWLMQNLWNIARYMADAREQVLPLVGSGEHDWTEIFSRFDCLAHDRQIAGKLSFIAWAGCIYAWKCLLSKYMKSRIA